MRRMLYVGLAQDSKSYYPVAMVVESREEDLGEFVKAEAFSGIEKRYLYSVDADANKKEAGYEGMTTKCGGTSTGSAISISDLLDLVNGGKEPVREKTKAMRKCRQPLKMRRAVLFAIGDK